MPMSAGCRRFAAPAAKDIASVESLGAFVVVRLNPKSALAQDEASACGLLAAVVRGLAARGGDAVAHPYPVTPLHGDYLNHADLAEAAMTRFGAAGVPASAAGSLKVRVKGALAEALVGPERRAEGALWDAAIEEVDAGRLVAAEMTSTNGWMGPRWVRSGWFQAYRLLADTVADPEVRQRVEADAARLRSGDIGDPTERANLERDLGAPAHRRLQGRRRRLYRQAGVLQRFLLGRHREHRPRCPRRAQLADVPAHREAQGLSLERLAETRDRGAAAAAWNPVAGFSDDFGRLMWSAIGDPAAIPSPYDHGWVLNRISEVEASPR